MGLKILAHYDETQGKYVLDYPMPVLFNEETKQWDLEHIVSWEEKFAQWKKGGPDKMDRLTWTVPAGSCSVKLH